MQRYQIFLLTENVQLSILLRVLNFLEVIAMFVLQNNTISQKLSGCLYNFLYDFIVFRLSELEPRHKESTNLLRLGLS